MDRNTAAELNEMNSEAIDLINGEFTINRVESTEVGEYTGKVHDLIVDETHNYVVEGLGVVHNGGKRKGAAAIYLEPHHPDILDFLELRDNSGEKEKRAYNLNLANWIPDEFMRRVRDNQQWSLFDPTVAPELTDLYGDEYTARYKQLEAEGKAQRVIPAHQLWTRMMKTLAETGNGWMCFKDTSNLRCNTAMTVPDTYHIRLTSGPVVTFVGVDAEVVTTTGTIPAANLTTDHTLVLAGSEYQIQNVIFRKEQRHVVHLSNLCTEIIETTSAGVKVEMTRDDIAKLTPDDFIRHSISLGNFNPETNTVSVNMGAETAVCNLGSVNVGKNYIKNGKLDVAKLHKNVDMAVRYLDRVIDRNFYPIPSAKASNDRLRPIGLGLMGLQDLFLQLRLPFESKEAIELGAKVQEEIYYQALKTSMELAKEFGAHRDFEYTKAAQGLLQFDLAGVTPKDVARWDALKAEIKQYGLRNSLLIAIAPTACQVGTNRIQTCDGVKSIDEIIAENEWDVDAIIANGQETWLDVKPFKVQTLNGEQEVTGMWFNGLRETFTITFDDRASYSYTANHKLMITRDGEHIWAQVHELKAGDLVRSNYGEATIVDIKPNGIKPTWDIEVANEHQYFMENGVVSHNTIATIVGASECIEPTKENLMKRETLSGEFITINKYLIDDLKKINMWNDQVCDSIKKNDGSIQQIPGLPADYYLLYKTVWETSQKVLIDHAIARGPYIDQAQSLNLYLDLNKYDEKRRIAVLSSMYMYAWNNGKGTKTSYYLRGKPASKIASTNSASNTITQVVDEVCESCQ